MARNANGINFSKLLLFVNYCSTAANSGLKNG